MADWGPACGDGASGWGAVIRARPLAGYSQKSQGPGSAGRRRERRTRWRSGAAGGYGGSDRSVADSDNITEDSPRPTLRTDDPDGRLTKRHQRSVTHAASANAKRTDTQARRNNRGRAGGCMSRRGLTSSRERDHEETSSGGAHHR